MLHAPKTFDGYGEEWLRERGFDLPPRSEFSLGCYAGEVTITDCFKKIGGCHGLWVEGPFCFQLEAPVAYSAPVPGRGMPGFWTLPTEEALRVIEAREAVGLCDPVLVPGEAKR